jgi:hypothetical protein
MKNRRKRRNRRRRKRRRRRSRKGSVRSNMTYYREDKKFRALKVPIQFPLVLLFNEMLW